MADEDPTLPLNKWAVKALRRSWIPGYGMIAGRHALKDIPWRGERGRKTAIRAIAINAVVTSLVAVGVVGSSALVESDDHLARVGELAARDCFTLPPTLRGTFNSMTMSPVVKVVRCQRPHDSEVYGRWRAPLKEAYPGRDELFDQADGTCLRQLSDYAADIWLWPSELSWYSIVPDADAWNRGARGIVCVATEDGQESLSASIRQDAGALTEVQRAYLEAVDPAELAVTRSPEEESAADDLEGWQRFADRMAAAERAESRALRARTWPVAAQQHITAMATQADQEAAAWRQAGAAGSAVQVDAMVDAARDRHSAAEAVAVRRVLGLATAPQESVAV